MILVESWKLVVTERFAKFDGRAGRAEFWWFALANLVAYAVLLILMGIGFAIADGLGLILGVLVVIYIAAVIIPSLALAIRRLHDTDKSGWWLLISLIPFGGIVLLVFYLLEGTPGPNKFGPAAEPDAT
ncbi:MAG: DUF805 domain-containing protein [Ilumatobacteraceae bacterium]